MPPVMRLNLCCTVYLTLWMWDSQRVKERGRVGGQERDSGSGWVDTLYLLLLLLSTRSTGIGAVAKCQQTFECRLSLTCPLSCLATRLSFSLPLGSLFSFRPSGVSLERNYVTGSVTVCESPKKPVRIIAHWGQLEARAWLALVAV